MDSTIPTSSPAPSALPSASADACPSCAAPMAFDQRYCLQCGQRRGEPRLPLMAGRLGTMASEPAAPVASAPAASRVPAGTTLVAGVGTLLLALGVGVLIGTSASSSSNTTAKAPVPQVITVGGAAAVPDAGAAADQAAAKDGASKKDKSKKRDSGSDVPVAKSGTTVKKKAGTVIKVGQKGKGRGYTDGKFTGDFFGQ